MGRRLDARLSDTAHIGVGGNMYFDPDFNPGKAKVMTLCAEIMVRLEQYL